MVTRIPNPIYNSENLSRFKSTVTWAEKLSVITELASPAFSQDQIKFLLSEDPANWAAQDQLLNQHGCGLTVLVPDSSTEIGLKIPTVYDINQEFQGAYILSKLTVDVLTEVMSLNELNRSDLKILDIGTGDGRILKELSDRGVTNEIHGLDTPNKRSYYVLNSTYNKFIETDLRYPLPIQDNTYDIIVCSNVLIESVMQMENDPPLTEDCLDEILRILVPGGIFVFNVDRFMCSAFDQKLNHLTNVSILRQQWGYHRDQMCMFPPTRLCTALTKI